MHPLEVVFNILNVILAEDVAKMRTVEIGVQARTGIEQKAQFEKKGASMDKVRSSAGEQLEEQLAAIAGDSAFEWIEKKSKMYVTLMS